MTNLTTRKSNGGQRHQITTNLTETLDDVSFLCPVRYVSLWADEEDHSVKLRLGSFWTFTHDGQLVHGPVVIDVIKEREIIDEDGVRLSNSLDLSVLF
jgi:hypothetical protein